MQECKVEDLSLVNADDGELIGDMNGVFGNCDVKVGC